MATNPPVTIGPFTNVPAPGSGVKSDWPQQISTYVTPTAWTVPTFTGAWTHYGAPYVNVGYRKIGDRVFLRGMAKTGSGAMFTLPAGFRPPGTILIVAVSNGAYGYVSVDAAGVVTAAGAAPVDLGGIQFSVTP